MFLVFELYSFSFVVVYTHFFFLEVVCPCSKDDQPHLAGCTSKGRLGLKKWRLVVLPQPPQGQVQGSQNSARRRDGRQWAQGAACEMLIRPKEILFHQEGNHRNRCVLAGTQNSSGEGPELILPLWLWRRWAQTSPRGPFQPQLLHDSVDKAEFKVLCFAVLMF